jgi:DHA1 family bicyclomycin/chloramphenicol resistance-like MFS transporter
MRTWRFSILNVAMALPVLAMFAFIAASPGIYISGFGLSEAGFGYFFGFNALAMMIGAYAFARLERRLGQHRVMAASFVGMAVGGASLIALPHPGPWWVALPMWLVSLCVGLSRPPSFNLVLEQVSGHTGSASSLISFATMMSGALAMSFISLDWIDKPGVIGGLALAGSLLALGAVAALRRD